MDEATRRGTVGNAVGKERNPVLVVVLTLVTFGIYGLYWQWSVMKEMDGFDPHRASPFAIAKWAIPLLLVGGLGYFVGFLTMFGGAAAGSEAGMGAGMIFFAVSVLAVFGAGIAMLVAQWRLWNGIEVHEQAIGVHGPISPGLMLALLLIPIVNVVGAFYVPYRTQQGLNRIWSAAGDGYEAEPPRAGGGFERERGRGAESEAAGEGA